KISAVWALVLSCIYFAAIFGAFVFALSRPAITGDSNPYALESKTEEGDWMRFADENFEFQMPGKPWYSIKPRLLNPAASLVLRKSSDSVSFLIIAEPTGIDFDITTDDLVDLVIANSEAAMDDPVVTRTDPVTVNGNEFQTVAIEGRVSNQLAYQSFYVLSRNGYYYQLLGVGKSAKEAEQIVSVMAQNFRQIDPDYVIYSTGNAFSEDVEMPEIGLTANVEGSGWIAWDAIDEEFPEADFGGLKSSYGYFGLTSFDLKGHEVSDEELAAAYLHVAWGETDYPDEVDRIEPFELGDLSGLEIWMTHKFNNSTMFDKIRVFQHEGRGWGMIVWVGEEVEDRLDETAGIFDLMQPGPAAADSDSKVNEHQAHVRGQLFNQLGLECYEKQEFERAADLFKTALSWSPDDETICLNVAYAYQELEDFEQAAAFLTEKLEPFSESADFVGELAWTFGKMDDVENASKHFERALDLGLNNDDYLLDHLNLLVNNEQLDNALAVVSKFHEAHGNDRTLRWKADMLDRSDQTEEAIRILTERYEKTPFDGTIAYDLAEYHHYQGDHERCLEICDKMDEDEPTWDVAWLRGHALMSLERYRDAKAAYERAIELNPDDPDLEHSLARASAALGEGNNSLVREKIEVVPIPGAVQQLLDEATKTVMDDEETSSYGARVIHRVRSIQWKPGERRRETNYTKVRITGEQGVESFKTFRFQFDPFAERMFVNSVEVHDDDGELVAEGKLDDFYVMDAGDSGMATEDQILNVPVPGLRSDVTLTIVVTRENLALTDQFHYTSYLFYDGYPSQAEALIIDAPEDRLKVEVAGELEEVRDQQLQAWISAPVPFARSEPLQPQLDEFLPAVWIADASKTWEAEGEEYLDELGNLLTKTPTEVEATADRIIGDLEEPEEIVQRLASFVRSELTYNALEFGPRGRIPIETARTLRNRYGDCKDHSLLLHHLLKTRGIESHLALADFDDRIMPELPDLNQFGHMILFVPNFRGGRFIDGTDDYIEAGNLPPDGLVGTNALILDPENIRLVEIPDPPSDSKQVQITRELAIEGTDLVVKEEAVLKGYAASRLRDFFSVRDQTRRKNSFQSTFDLPRMRVRSVDIAEIENSNIPLKISAQYTLANAIEGEGNVEFPLPATWETFYLEPEFYDDRRSPFEFVEPIQIEVEWRWEDDKTWNLGDDQLAATEATGPFGNWNQKLTESGAALVWSFNRKPGEFPAEEYEDYISATEDAMELWHEKIQVDLSP
ncbi:MAG: tetratricopeptide repeat protein, partial [Verrucomicrobiota bacterium]